MLYYFKYFGFVIVIFLLNLSIDVSESKGLETTKNKAHSSFNLLASSTAPMSQKEIEKLREEAQRLYELESFVRSESLSQEEAFNNLTKGEEEYKNKRYKLAIQYWKKALNAYKKINNLIGEINCLKKLAFVHSKSDYTKAIDYYKELLRISRNKNIDFTEKIDYPRLEAYSLIGLGWAYSNFSKYPEAIEYHEQALTVANEIAYYEREVNSEKVNSLIGLGWSYYRTPI